MEDPGAPGTPFECGSVIQVATQREKQGEAAIDDLIMCLPQPRAYRLAKHRQRMEALLLQQIDGPLLELPWEVDHPKDAGSRWRMQQEQQQQMRRPVSEGRRAIEEFGPLDDEEGVDHGSNSNAVNPLFSDATRAEFARPMRSLPLQQRHQRDGEAPGDYPQAPFGRRSRGAAEPLDEMELLRRGREMQQQQQPHPRHHVDLEPILISAEETDDEKDNLGSLPQSEETERNPQTGQQSVLGRHCRRKRPLPGAPCSSTEEQEEADGEEEEASERHKPWGSFASREEWAERVVRENEQLMSRWRARSRQRVSEGTTRAGGRNIQRMRME